MKRIMIGIFSLISILLLPTNIFAAELPEMHTKSFILVDSTSGEILAGDHMEVARPPASMTKMMSGIIIFEQIKQGKLQWNDLVTVSQRAAAINEAEIRLVPNETLTVKELVTAMFVQSANDATVALAEHIAGSEEAFVQLMNQKASELGLKHTHFQNSTGLDDASYPDPPTPNGDGQHVMSAYDASIVANYLLTNFPEVLRFSSIPNYTFHPGSSRVQTVNNWDLMLPTLQYAYEGVDGLKTGHTNAAGFCFTGTAVKNGFRLISVVMGTNSEYARFHETQKLLDYGYKNYQIQTPIKQGIPIANYKTIAIPNGVEETVAIAPKDSLSLPELIDEANAYSYHVTLQKGIQAPLAKGTVIGSVTLMYKGKPILGIQSIPLVTQKQVEKGSFLRLFFRQVWHEVNSWLD